VRSLVRGFDRFLSRVNHICPFDAGEGCILRLQRNHAPHAMQLPGCLVQAGDPVLSFHLWNERVPRLPPTGPDLAWAAATRRLFVASLQLLARYVLDSPDLAGAAALFGVTSLFAPQTNARGFHPMQRLGFTIAPYRSPLGSFGNFWENFYAWALMWAYNPNSADFRRFMNLQRTEMWMPTPDFLARYGNSQVMR
jgi:YkoP domain